MAGRRILGISNETFEGTVLSETPRPRAHNIEGEAPVVALALNSYPRRAGAQTPTAS